MSPVREAIERAVDQLVDEHVPGMWRQRARLYVPMVVARLTAAVEAVVEAREVGK